MTVHPLLRNSLILKLTSESLLHRDGHRASDLSAFARAFLHAKAPANAVLYHTLDIRSTFLSTRCGYRRFTLLLRTLRANLQLLSLVVCVKTGLPHIVQVMELPDVCSSLRVVHSDLTANTRGGMLEGLMPNPPWPTLPNRVQSLFISEETYISGASWVEDFIETLVSASGIRILSLRTNEVIAGRVLSVLSPQLVALDIDLHGWFDAAASLVSIGASTCTSLKNLKHLRVRDFGPGSAQEAALQRVAPSLQRLTIERISFLSFEILCECLADPTWCPDLLSLPVILFIYLGKPYSLLEELDTTTLKAHCAMAKAACLERSGWRKPADQFERVRRRIFQIVECHNVQVGWNRARYLRHL